MIQYCLEAIKLYSNIILCVHASLRGGMCQCGCSYAFYWSVIVYWTHLVLPCSSIGHVYHKCSLLLIIIQDINADVFCPVSHSQRLSSLSSLRQSLAPSWTSQSVTKRDSCWSSPWSSQASAFSTRSAERVERASTTVSSEWYSPAFLSAIFVHSLDLFNAELFLVMYWRGEYPEGEGKGEL